MAKISTLNEALKTDFFLYNPNGSGIFGIYKNGKSVIEFISGRYSLELLQDSKFQSAFFLKCLELSFPGPKVLPFYKYMRDGAQNFHYYIQQHLTIEEKLALYEGLDVYRATTQAFIRARAKDYNDGVYDRMFIDVLVPESMNPMNIYSNKDNHLSYYGSPFPLSKESIQKTVNVYSKYIPLYQIHFLRLVNEPVSFFKKIFAESKIMTDFMAFIAQPEIQNLDRYIENSSTGFLEALAELHITIPKIDVVRKFGSDNDGVFTWHLDNIKEEFKHRTQLFFKIGGFNSKYSKNQLIASALKQDYFFILESMLNQNLIQPTLLKKTADSIRNTFSTHANAFVMSHTVGVKVASPTETVYKEQARVNDAQIILDAIKNDDHAILLQTLPLVEKNIVLKLAPQLYWYGFEKKVSKLVDYLQKNRIPIHRHKKTIESVMEYLTMHGSLTTFKEGFKLSNELDAFTLSRMIEICVEKEKIEQAKLIFNKYPKIPFLSRALGMAMYGGMLAFVNLIVDYGGHILTRHRYDEKGMNIYGLIERSKGFYAAGNQYHAEFSSLAIGDRFRYHGKTNSVLKIKKGSEADRLKCIRVLFDHQQYDEFSLGLMTTLAMHDDQHEIANYMLGFKPYILEKVRTANKRSIGISFLGKESKKRLESYLKDNKDMLTNEDDLKNIARQKFRDQAIKTDVIEELRMPYYIKKIIDWFQQEVNRKVTDIEGDPSFEKVTIDKQIVFEKLIGKKDVKVRIKATKHGTLDLFPYVDIKYEKAFIRFVMPSPRDAQNYYWKQMIIEGNEPNE
jgi:hypothetical protein